MEYDKDRKINRYYNLDEILQLDLDLDIKNNFNEKFGKKVFFDFNNNCKIGKLCGIKKDHQFIYYIINTDNKELFIPIYQSITKL